MSYSLDLRERVVRFLDSGFSKASAVRIFGISRGTLYRWLDLKARTSHLSDPPLIRKPRKIDSEILLKRIHDNPECLLKEHAAHFGVRIQSISMALQRLGVTRKKRYPFIWNETKRSEQTF